MTETRAIPALTRGLELIDFFVGRSDGLRYSEIKAHWPALADSTLTRLLRSLEAAEWLLRDADALYHAGPRLLACEQRIRGTERPLRRRLEELARGLSLQTHESAAVVRWQGESLMTVASVSVPDGVSVLEYGHRLHFEADHAASLAVLAQLSRKERLACLHGPHSRIASERAYHAGVKAARREDGCWLDESCARPGVSRLAVGLTLGDLPGALFLCLTTATARRDYPRLSEALLTARQVWEAPGTVPGGAC